MAIVVTFQVEGTEGQKLYADCITRITNGRGFTSPADLPVPGLLAHIAGPVDGGWRVVDVWESSEALEAFAKHLGPILAELGYADLHPDVTPAYNVVLR